MKALPVSFVLLVAIGCSSTVSAEPANQSSKPVPDVTEEEMIKCISTLVVAIDHLSASDPDDPTRTYIRGPYGFFPYGCEKFDSDPRNDSNNPYTNPPQAP